ncbi:cysteine-rich receptor-like protein kinase [Tanacetum coccineum]
MCFRFPQDGRWNENLEDIKQTIFNYYQGVFKETNSNRLRFDSGCFRRLSQGDASLLEAPFADEEIYSSYGFKVVLEGRQDFSVKVKKVINKIIGEVQSAFIKDLFILDGVLVINEVVEFIKKSRKRCLIFKVDFEKAYDCVNWKFLEDIMQQMGFGRKWCGWIRACLESATCSVLVNGSPTKEFALERGIRQGDPLSPFLFLIVAESLNVAMQEVVQGGLFDGVKVGSDGIEVSHLQYADDTIFVGDWNRRNIISLMKLLKCFQMDSGLKVNLKKVLCLGLVWRWRKSRGGQQV